METFLADYGLVWVGSNRSDSDSECDESNIEKTDSEYDWIKIVRNVKERVLGDKPDSWSTYSVRREASYSHWVGVQYSPTDAELNS